MTPLALPLHSCTCEWCEKPMYAYSGDTCPACQKLFDDCLDAEKDLRCRLVGIARMLIPEWLGDWRSRLSAANLSSAGTFTLRSLELGEKDDFTALIQDFTDDLADQYGAVS